LWGQPIKLAQVVSTSELLENQRNEFVFFKIILSHFCRASEASKLTASKIKYEKFLVKKWIFWCPNIKDIEFFGHLKYNFRTS
jgi:hypothetical protein